MPSSHDHTRSWIGRTQTDSERVCPRLARQLAATFDHPRAPQAGETLPWLWHWALFPSIATQAHLGADGHPQRGGFLPPIPLPRRMWAGSRVRFERPVVVGRVVTRTSQIVDIASKQGRSGQLAFVRLRHELEDSEGPLLSEEQDVVYREAALEPFAPASSPLAPTDAGWRRTIVPDPVLLFRYSAATFNAHRIHYDRTYATTQEAYPALVVHGPLTATLLVDLVTCHAPGEDITSFSFKALNPIFDNGPFQLCGRCEPDSGDIRLWAVNDAGVLCVDARATLRAAAATLSADPRNAAAI
jgi:3-methylfumaryl-CoA hydratase